MNKGRGVANRHVTEVEKLRSAIRQVRIADNGLVLKNLPADPPAYVQIPWNSIVLSDTFEVGQQFKQKKYTGGDLFAILKAQTGLDDKAERISMRIKSVKAWEVSGKSINLEANDLTIGFGENDYLAQVSDHPGRNRWGKVGYMWPESQQKVIFSGNDSETLVTLGSAVTQPVFVCRFDILWKIRVNTTPN